MIISGIRNQARHLTNISVRFSSLHYGNSIAMGVRAGRLSLICLTFVLAACGGGGGSDSSTGAQSSSVTSTPPAPSMTMSAQSIDVSAAINSATPPSATTRILVENFPAAGLYIDYEYTKNTGINVSFTSGTFNISFPSPSSLALSTYHDNLVVHVCSDSACKNEIIGSPATVPINYEVRKPTVAEAPLLSTSSANVRSEFITQSGTPPLYIDLSFAKIPTTITPQITVTSTHNGVVAVTSYGVNYNSGIINVALKPPNQLRAGTFTDVITVTACIDAQCSMPFGNSPLAVPVTYTVTDTVPGAYGATVDVLPSLTPNDLIYDSARQKLYLSVPSTSPTAPNSIAVINPQASTLESYVFAGSEPGVLAISSDSQRLYVGLKGANSVSRFSLPSLSADTSINLGLAGFFAGDIAVLPSDSTVVAVSAAAGNPVVVFDGTTARPNSITTFTNQYGTFNAYIGSIVWKPDGTALYAVDPNKSFTMPVNSNGVSLTAEEPSNEPGKIQLANGRLYTASGRVFDAATGNLLGTFTVPSGSWIKAFVVDTALNRAYALVSTFNAAGLQLQSFNLTTLTPLGLLTLPGTVNYYATPRLVRWGTDGLALLSGDDASMGVPSDRKLYLIHGSFVTN